MLTIGLILIVSGMAGFGLAYNLTVTRHGGLTFVRIGRLGGSWYVAKS